MARPCLAAPCPSVGPSSESLPARLSGPRDFPSRFRFFLLLSESATTSALSAPVRTSLLAFFVSDAVLPRGFKYNLSLNDPSCGHQPGRLVPLPVCHRSVSAFRCLQHTGKRLARLPRRSPEEGSGSRARVRKCVHAEETSRSIRAPPSDLAPGRPLRVSPLVGLRLFEWLGPLLHGSHHQRRPDWGHHSCRCRVACSIR